jgi:hypothetical protein
MDPLIILAIGIAIGGLAGALLNCARPSKAVSDAYKIVRKGPLKSAHPVHFPTTREVNDWGERGDVVKLRNSEPKIPTGGNAA